MKKPALVIVALAGALALAYFLLGDGGPPDRSSAAQAPTAETPLDAPAPQADLEGAQRLVQEPKAEASTGVVESLGSARAVLTPSAPALEPDAQPDSETGPQLEIQVVEKATRRPMPGISVWLLEFDDQAEPPPDWIQVMQTGGVGALIERFGLHRVSDREGRCRLPEPKLEYFVRASGQGFVGSIEPGTDHVNPLVIEVEHEAGIRVDVAGPDGQLLSGVPVGITIAQQDYSESPVFCLVSAVTEGEPPAALLSSPMEFNDRFNDPRGPRLFAEVLGVFSQPAEPRVTLPDNGGIAVHLSIPEVGTVVLHTPERAGASADSGENRNFDLQIVGGNGRPLAVSMVEGVGSSPWIELGLQLAVYSTRLTSRGFQRTLVGTFEGPTKDRPRVDFTITAPEEPTVAGRALDEAGQPLGRQRVSLEIVYPETSGTPRGAEFEALQALGYVADSDETASIPAANASAVRALPRLDEHLTAFRTEPDGSFEGPANWIERLRVQLRNGEIEGIRATVGRSDASDGKIEIPLAAFEGQDLRVDLGELRFQPLPLQLAGQVVDQPGKPVSGTLEYSPTYDPLSSAAHPPLTRWETYELRVGSNGRFEIRGDQPGTHFLLSFQGQRHCTTESVYAPLGSTDYRLEVVGAGALEYSFAPIAVAPDLGTWYAVQPVLFLEGSEPAESEEQARQWQTQFRRDSLRLSPIPEGIYRVEFSLDDLKLPALTREHVEILAGRTVKLGELDISHDLIITKLVFIDLPPGSPPPGVGLSSNPDAGEVTLQLSQQEHAAPIAILFSTQQLPSIRLFFEGREIEVQLTGQEVLVRTDP